MIPIKLQVRNFLSYGPTLQTIDFSSHRLICLSGKNGHGKSALLDAITWAVWGQARKIAGVVKADQGLLRLGQTKMMVILDFACGDQTYRVKREYAIINGKPYTTLEFGLSSEENNRIIPLTDKTIRRTQEKIEQTIKLDYESFVNSAFLRQGNANEFSKKSPKDRKVVLANILGLNQYEAVRKRATEKVKTAQLQQQRLSALQEKYDEELQATTKIAGELKEVTSCLNTLKKQEKKLETEQSALSEEQKNYTKAYEELSRSEKNYAALKTEHEQKKDVLQNTIALWRKTNRELLSLGSRQDLEKEKTKLIKTIEEQQTIRNNHLTIKEKLLKTTEQLHAEKRTVQKKYESKLYTQKLTIERCKADGVTATNTIKQLQQQVEQVEKHIEENTLALINLKENSPKQLFDNKEAHALRVEFERRKEKYHTFVAQGAAAQTELNDLTQKAALADSSEGEPCCPLCEQNLSASRRKFLAKKFEHSEKFLTHRIARLRSVVSKLKSYLIEKHDALKAYDVYVQEKSVQKVKHKQLEETILTHQKSVKTTHDAIKKVIELCKKHDTALVEHKKKLKGIEQEAAQSLDKEPTISALQKSIMHLEKEAKKVTFDAELYKKTQEKIRDLEAHLKRHTEIEASKDIQRQRKMNISQLCTALKKMRIEITQLEKKCKDGSSLEQTKNIIGQKQKELDTKKIELRTERESNLQKMGSFERQQLFLKRVQEERNKLIKTIKEFKETQADYQAIAHATGKDGIQALLIEEAIPEIEHEANVILSHLTDNECHIILESLRNLKKGGTKETLDIKISDANGIRPYELFSGGEAFRIDLALRIAISQLLTRRSGTTLQTLIIDEGFGSQDEEGLAHIMDSLYRLQDNFLKVIIVSHLTSMKDQFPVHMVVEKRSSGSIVSVIEHG